MTKLAAEAWAKLQELEDSEQDYFARKLLAEIESERKWDELLATPESQAMLAEWAAEAMADYHAGRTKPLIPEEL